MGSILVLLLHCVEAWSDESEKTQWVVKNEAELRSAIEEVNAAEGGKLYRIVLYAAQFTLTKPLPAS